MTDKVETTAKANSTAAARKQYGKGTAVKAASTPKAKGRRVPVVAGPPVAQPATGKKGGVPDVQPPAPDPHSYGALDTNPPEAAAEVAKVAERKARGEKPEPEEGAKRGKRKASRKKK